MAEERVGLDLEALLERWRGWLVADVAELVVEADRLRATLEAIAAFADTEAADASKRYDANLTDLASCISALRIIEAKARFALTGEAP